MSAGNKGTLLLSLVVSVVLSLLAISAHATVFWDDELELGNTGYPNYFSGSYNPCGGIPSFENDTANKISGSASLKMNYPGTPEFYQLCGGFEDRTFTPSDDIWLRFHIHLSSNWETSHVMTKLPRIDQTSHPTAPIKNWLAMFNGSLSVTLTAENYPATGHANNFPANAGDGVLPRNQWVCLEAHFVNNSPDQSNGIYQLYKNGMLVANHTAMVWRREENGGNSNHWQNIRLYRQNGGGSINYDRLAVGNTRIGCLGSSPTSDTTPPVRPSGLFLR
jgi:hypothetical protein